MKKDIFATSKLNNTVNKNTVNREASSEMQTEKKADEKNQTSTFSLREKVEPKIVFDNHKEFNINYDSDFGKLSYNFIDGKLWMAEHGCTFTDEEIGNLGAGKISMLEITLKKLFNAKVSVVNENDNRMLDKIMAGI